MITTVTKFAPAIALLLATTLPPGPSPADLSAALASGSLSDNQIIRSESLGYDLQYRVYLPAGYEDLSDLPVLFLTDGQWYIDQGGTPRILDGLIERGEIEPTIAVFVDNRDPHRLNVNRRNQQFFCNTRYIQFITDELVPHIDSRYETTATPASRAILGLSFGGLNSACFGLHAYETIGGIAMQSPAMHPVRDLIPDYRSAPKRPVRIFLSTGTDNDNQATTRRFKTVLEDKGYELSYVEVPFGHNWSNWGPLIDDVLLYFFGREQAPLE